ncbi:AAA family ATPase [Solidesulfovibrio carbinolicus]|nr:nuclease-related domain-containing DEAD/DEAH box helicase [Solidesulfovibrio carbinolicus]
MAQFFPACTNDFRTDGEERFYRFLDDATGKGNRFLVWYGPNVGGFEPDFIVFHPDIGLVVFEVKDWAVSQLLEADPHGVRLRMGGTVERRDNPLRQARDYALAIMDALHKDGRLLSRDPFHAGKVALPVQHGAVFANIFKSEAQEVGLLKIFPADKVLYLDDIHHCSDLSMDASGQALTSRLLYMFRPPFPFAAGRREIDILCDVLFPVARIRLPQRGNQESRENDQIRLALLDRAQEAVAQRIAPGRTLVTGPAGSGKTLVLVHQAALLRRSRPDIGPILMVCYNICLVGYLKRLLVEQGLPLGPAGVEVRHFYELCQELTDIGIEYEGHEADYYTSVVEMALESAQMSGPRYSAILVDEGQDFTAEMLKVLLALLNEKSGILTITLDEAQSIYQAHRTWEGSGLDVNFQKFELKSVYRNTIEIIDFVNKWLKKDGKAKTEVAGQLRGVHGPIPLVFKVESSQEAVEKTSQILQSYVKEGVSLSEMAVLFAATRDREGHYLPSLMVRSLEEKALLAGVISRDAYSKADFDITSKRVAVSTVHSAKGLDWLVVVVIGLEYLDSIRMGLRLPALSLVGLTRARERLVVIDPG